MVYSILFLVSVSGKVGISAEKKISSNLEFQTKIPEFGQIGLKSIPNIFILGGLVWTTSQTSQT